MDVSTIGPTILNSLSANVTSSINELTPIKSTDTNIVSLIGEYERLNTQIKTTLTNISKYDATSFPTELSSLNTKISTLDAKKDKFLVPFIKPKEISAGSIFSDTITEMKTHIILITTVLGMIFGCIVTTHWLITSNMEIGRNTFYYLFYAFYGSLLFPLPILYGVLFPPMWRAPLIPLFERDEKSPAWVDFPLINFFTYAPPQPNDLPTGKMVLRVMCIIITGLIGVSLSFKITGNNPLN